MVKRRKRGGRDVRSLGELLVVVDGVPVHEQAKYILVLDFGSPVSSLEAFLLRQGVEHIFPCLTCGAVGVFGRFALGERNYCNFGSHDCDYIMSLEVGKRREGRPKRNICKIYLPDLADAVDRVVTKCDILT